MWLQLFLFWWWCGSSASSHILSLFAVPFASSDRKILQTTSLHPLNNPNLYKKNPNPSKKKVQNPKINNKLPKPNFTTPKKNAEKKGLKQGNGTGTD
jgi:hypothetical protein